ncbi:DUF664 domain-containing protein [Cellulomonas sp. zg-ZUI199]|uniref:DUF664 domain-containing protein n=1 Tax=Cellulomonas wangleii TaxID=2816956 RepID=A0ABX8D5D4_9CELL|nr:MULTISPECIES: DUF664 domain-containing protein [Cellulomonas]MBO0900147.1 DUF664 domain-containing protein [Cellulomonas sp. zg-ZUI22]MBO0925581.1 DUF664 domain-containing protein [Cellulomonas wangleii]QVI60957.1 DUF664 domain-containing protein [Cellulomonas wangleii]
MRRVSRWSTGSPSADAAARTDAVHPPHRQRARRVDPRGVAHDRSAAREVLVHLVEEYARHLGHADLLRERIDGRIGQ